MELQDIATVWRVNELSFKSLLTEADLSRNTEERRSPTTVPFIIPRLRCSAESAWRKVEGDSSTYPSGNLKR
jgi:hypothetical protein